MCVDASGPLRARADLNITGIRFENGDAQGSYIASRTGSTSMALYKDGSSLGTDSTEAAFLPVETFSIFAEHRGSGSFVDISTDQVASAFVGGGMDSTMASAYHTAEAAYMTAVGAI
jgi:hypothetical protein